VLGPHELECQVPVNPGSFTSGKRFHVADGPFHSDASLISLFLSSFLKRSEREIDVVLTVPGQWYVQPLMDFSLNRNLIPSMAELLFFHMKGLAQRFSSSL